MLHKSPRMFVLVLRVLSEGKHTARGAISGSDSIGHTIRTVVETIRTVVEYLYKKCRVQLREHALEHRRLGTGVNGRVDHAN